ncbi:PREDICTED: DEP domain-containing protein DDB_G0279099-like [Eufriesea mexicana]|uniref:DEP domain-containing protein DDB_G0279099-like n=1 Tax=Eufriesea mexicana TaxID=516756 RepID=UPI00083C6998|nr:PREDICTED: DEP domain-containing protein DDB_G0279099-like [Eufriesea mexicana]
MTSEETSRTCYVCKKLFCCALCRERHEEKKHTKRQPNCPICANQKLPLKAFEDPALLCHMVTTHLPLYCYLCGEIFKQSKDLESFGTCKWWKSQHRRSLKSEQKPILGTPPLTSEGKESSEYNGSNISSLTSPPELYRNTSTPMVVGQKTSFDFKTPNCSNFSLKTSKIDSASVKNSQTYSNLQGSNSKSDSSNSNYVSLPSATVEKEIPLRLVPSNHGDEEELSKNKLKVQNTMKDKNDNNPSECYIDNNCVEDMELTNIEHEVLPDSQNLDIYPGERRSDSSKRVRFSDEYENPVEPNSVATFNMTENEEYFEACDTLSEMKQSLEKSQIKIYEDNARNTEKENNSPVEVNVNDKHSSGTSRVVMMVVVENNSNISTSDLIDSGLRKLDRAISNMNFSNNSQSYASCSSSLTSSDCCYSASSDNYYSYRNDSNNPPSRSSNTSPNNKAGSSSSTGLLSVVTNAVKSVMKNLPGFSKNVEEGQVSSRVIPTPSTSESSMLNSASSILQRPGKRPRDVTEYIPSTQRQTDFSVPQVEPRSPLAKRHRGWYKIKGREPIARMRNRQHPSPRGISSETQVFHQGSLSVGNTVLPLPDRAHQSTQTE